MNFVFSFLISFTFLLPTYAQDSKTYLGEFYSKIYSLKSKGVQDFVVDVTSSKLTDEINQQKILGNIKKVIFRVYWTSNPERMSLEILGLPEGFREIKESLKLSFSRVLEDLVPLSFETKYPGFKTGQIINNKTYELIDASGLNTITKFIFSFDDQTNLVQIKGVKPVGEFLILPTYKKTNFSDGRWVLENIKTISSENGIKTEVTKEYNYSEIKGVWVLDEISSKTLVTSQDEKVKPISSSEDLEFSNYKINQGLAFKYFLSDKN